MTNVPASESKISWRAEPTPVEMVADEVWIAEKFQSNPDIAGSPRNSFRASLVTEIRGGRALNGLGADKVTEPYQTTNAIESFHGSQTV